MKANNLQIKSNRQREGAEGIQMAGVGGDLIAKSGAPGAAGDAEEQKGSNDGNDGN